MINASPRQYEAFLEMKSQIGGMSGFDPVWTPDFLYDFQSFLVDWSLRKGRALVTADCGLGKTPMQLVWADNVVRKTNRPVLVITPLAVSQQTAQEAEKFGIDSQRSREGTFYGSRIVITNYERLHYFDPNDFAGVVCDESSAIKNFHGERQKIVTDFMRKIQYRLLCTATASPNDFIELGTSSEALGELGRMDMLSQFFRNDEGSLHPIWWGARWQFKAHAEHFFWRWVCSWCRACRKPSDLGFADDRFVLPELITRETIVKADKPRGGLLFDLPAVTLNEQREERRLTLTQRCEAVRSLVADTNEPAVVWCHQNTESDRLEKIIHGAKQVSGSQSDDEKEELFTAFSSGELRVLVTKPKIGAFGLNWQHCAHQTFFPSHSFEQYYQGVRRSWRFGQTRPVTIDIVTSEGEAGVMKNLQRKADQADKMFAVLVAEMQNELKINRTTRFEKQEVMPAWL